MPIQIQQHKQAGPTGGATTLTVTLTSPTQAGNRLIVAAGATAGTGGITGITLGGVADNWQSDAHLHQGTGTAEDVDVWSDPNCAGGQTVIVLSYPTGASHSACDVWEVSGLATSLPADKSSTGSVSSAGSAFDSGATATTSQAAEFWVGAVVDIGASNPAITGPATPWANSSQVNIGGLGSYLAGQQITAATGAADYSGSFSPNATYAAAVVTYKGASSAASPSGLLLATFP